LTAWLVFMLIANAAAAVANLAMSDVIRQRSPDMPGWAIPVLVVMTVFNLACTVALLRWKKWGFWGVCASSLVGVAVNLSSGLGIGSSLLGLLGVALLYGVLQIGTENKGWPQLE